MEMICGVKQKRLLKIHYDYYDSYVRYFTIAVIGFSFIRYYIHFVINLLRKKIRKHLAALSRDYGI